MGPVRSRDERIVILAPSANDGPVMAGVFAEAGFEPAVVESVAELCQAVRDGAGVLVIADEALSERDEAEKLRVLLEAQEPWSGLPILLLAASASEQALPPVAEAVRELGNVTVLDRPLRRVTLLSAARTALWSRRRQYAARAVLQEFQTVGATLREREAQFRTVVENSRDGINMLDLASGRYVLLSPAQVALTGFEEAELRGMTAAAALDRVHPDDREIPLRQQRAIAAGEQSDSTVEYRWRVKSGEYRWFSDSRKVVRNERGEPIALVGVSRDITERKRADEELRLADQRKSEFIAVLSHELRNPLAPIRNGIHLLERAPPGSELAKRGLEVLRRQSEHLTRLVEDLLDVTRISRGKVELRLARLDARPVVARAVEDAREGFEHRGITLRFSDAAAPIWIDVDAARLTQMLGNLLHNALKFTPPGGSVEVSLESAEGAMELLVRDSGAGIEPGQLEAIFEPFVQAERTQGRHGGLGIGLTLVRALAEKHGGSIQARSEGPGRGATFVLRLPTTSPPSETSSPSLARASIPALSILVVEDNEDAATTLSDLLALSGHKVTLASSGRAGIEKALTMRPDVLLCDVGLPDMSGHDVVRRVRAAFNGGAGRLFAVALTGYAQPKDRADALAAGFDAHLGKPAPIEELRSLLCEAARAKSRQTASS